MQTEMIFNRKDQAQKVHRRLRHYNVLSRVCAPRESRRGAELVIEVPDGQTGQSVWELAKKIHQGFA